MQSSYLTARETAERLGIKRDTLYAYVSRGLLRSVAVPGSRERGYRTEEAERLRAGRGLSRATRRRRPSRVTDSAICLMEDGRLYYRGHDAIRLDDAATLEDIADLLWGAAGTVAPTLTLPRLRRGGLSEGTPKKLPRQRGGGARPARRG